MGQTDAELCKLSRRSRDLGGKTRMVMEATGNDHLPVASFLYDSGFYVSVVNAMLVHGYGNNSLRWAKTDKKDAINGTCSRPPTDLRGSPAVRASLPTGAAVLWSYGSRSQRRSGMLPALGDA